MKAALHAILAIVVLFGSQAIANIGAILLTAYQRSSEGGFPLFSSLLSSFTGETTLSPAALAFSGVASSILAAGLLFALHLIAWKDTMRANRTGWKWGVVSVLAALSLIVALNILSEWMPLPDMMENVLTAFTSHPAGMLYVGVLGPVTEELVFREAVLGRMLHTGLSPLTAIILSAIIFGVIHLNPAQIPPAIGIGLVLGIIYYKTGSILLTSAVHILNNSTAVLTIRLLGDDWAQTKLSDLFGSDTTIVVFVLSALVGGLFLVFFWKKSPTSARFAGLRHT